MEKIEMPKLIEVGKLEEAVGGGGKNNDDGSGYTKLANNTPLKI